MSKQTLFHVVTHFADGSHGEATGLTRAEMLTTVATASENPRFCCVLVRVEGHR